MIQLKAEFLSSISFDDNMDKDSPFFCKVVFLDEKYEKNFVLF